ncbi:MAG: glutaminyl-peptide cyclotransferase [Prolixibacteraceae bacterium]
MKTVIVALIIIIIGFSGCSSSTTSRKPVTNIQITPSNNVVVYGNEFSIVVQSKIVRPKITELTLYLNNKLIKQSTDPDFSVSINSKEYTTGKYSIKTVAKNEDGKIGVNYSSISIISDITPKKLGYKLHGQLPHNTSYYTEGLEFYKGKLYEGTGNYGESYVTFYKPNSIKNIKSHKNDKQYFGEGITILDEKLYQLTYKSKKGFIYEPETLEKIAEFNFDSKEGWGLTNDGIHLIMSNGSSIISFINPKNFKVEKTIEVSTPTGFVSNINELEYLDGVIYANIWTTQTIAKIEASTGRVLAFINMEGILTNLKNKRIDVMNGIAYEPEQQLFYITGKWWPYLYQVTFE